MHNELGYRRTTGLIVAASIATVGTLVHVFSTFMVGHAAPLWVAVDGGQIIVLAWALVSVVTSHRRQMADRDEEYRTFRAIAESRMTLSIKRADPKTGNWAEGSQMALLDCQLQDLYMIARYGGFDESAAGVGYNDFVIYPGEVTRIVSLRVDPAQRTTELATADVVENGRHYAVTD